MEFRLLGPLQAIRDGRPLELGGTRQRALLAVLLLHRGAVVPTDRLIDELWGENPPSTAAKTVQVYISRLRKVLGDGVVMTQSPGYRVALGAVQLDLARFESLAAEGGSALREGDAVTAADRLREALALWRGPPLGDLAYEPFAQSEVARLEAARLDVVQQRVDADLQLARHPELVGELESLVNAHPTRERLVGQLMLALYRSGRQADALAVYRGSRRRLRDELGLEPGPELRTLERQVLEQDPALTPPTGSRAAAPPTRPVPQVAGWMRALRSRRLITTGAALVLVVAIAAGAAELSGGAGLRTRVAPNSLAAIDARTDHIVGAVPVGARPGEVVSGFGSLWVANLDDQTISRVDPVTLSSLRTIATAGPPTGLATSVNGVWAVESTPSPDSNVASSVLVGRVDPEFDTIGAQVRIGNVVPDGPGAIAAAGNSVWVAPSDGLLTRLNASTAVPTSRLDPNAAPSGLAIGAGATWLTDTEADNVVRVDPTGLLSTIPVGIGPTAITTGAGAVWVVDSLDDAVVRIDPSTQSVTATIPVGRSPAGIAFGAGSVWVADSGDGTVTRIDPGTDRVRATIAVGGSPQSVTVADGRAWVSVDAQSIAPARSESGSGTMRIVSTDDVDYMDPALAYEALSDQLLAATCAGLVGYPDRAGPAGSQLTPDVAQSLPARSADGRTYTFTIRPGLRFSPPSNQRVTAATFKDTIERTLSPGMHSPLAHYLSDVVGATAYMTGRTRHITGVIATGNTLRIRLLAAAPDLPARLAMPAFCAVPPDTPINRNGVAIIPSAGPYYVTSYTPGQGVILTRNPNYHGPRPRHFGRIELQVGVSPQQAVQEIQSGAADYTDLGLGSHGGASLTALNARLAARYGPGSAAAASGKQRYFVDPSLQLDYYYLNTRRPPFSDVRLRRAANEAIDRVALAALGSGFAPLPERPADHYLPPGMPGYRNVHVYPMTPDVSKARQLVRRADPHERTAVLDTCDTGACAAQAQIVKTDLAAIGLRVQVRTLPLATLFSREATPGASFDIAYQGWIPDYDDPAAMLSSILEDSSVGPTFTDPGVRRRLAAAERLTGPERYLTYGALDLDIARGAAPLLAFGNIVDDSFFSARIGCQIHGIYGVDLAALCLRSQSASAAGSIADPP